ncbi:MAG: 30S ribosomal protein S17 [Patescibacteria group bacterium]
MAKRRLTGIVVSDKMAKTVVVKVQRLKQHLKYLRRMRMHEKYKAHDEKQEYHTGDRVVIEETRPLSKEKRWRVIEKL